MCELDYLDRPMCELDYLDCPMCELDYLDRPICELDYLDRDLSHVYAITLSNIAAEPRRANDKSTPPPPVLP